MDEGFSAAGQRAGEGTPAVQPRDLEHESDALIAQSDLRQFEATAAARHLARITADQEIMLMLSVEGFEGRAWIQVAEALVEYGWAVMRAWIVTGQVFVKCAEKRLGGEVMKPPGEGMRRDDALALADETVADAIVNFRDNVLARGRWDSSKGASLATFFIGNCLLRFVNNYRKWRTATGRERLVEVVPAAREGDDPSTIVIDELRRREILEPIKDPQNRAILQLDADGISVEEIADLLDMTYKQVESRLYRARRQLGRGEKRAG